MICAAITYESAPKTRRWLAFARRLSGNDHGEHENARKLRGTGLRAAA
jgi:hypothetical protein